MSKKRTLNEYRQNKDFGYKKPKTETIIDDYYRKVDFDPQYIVDLIKENPNDTDLGEAIRKYYLQLKKIS
ncbi:hypothetical protein N9966_00730 [bacterium]|nr:hypothetical protein [bacterium]